MKKIYLTRGAIALVDDEDYDRLNKFKWCWDERAVIRSAPLPDGCQTTVRMHRVIMNAPVGIKVDHRDGNPLNNQKFNLRFATYTENAWNQRPQHRPNKSSRFKGVHLVASVKKWQAVINPNGRNINLGLFTEEVAAAKAYDKAAIEHFGEFARLNFK